MTQRHRQDAFSQSVREIILLVYAKRAFVEERDPGKKKALPTYTTGLERNADRFERAGIDSS